MPLNKAYHQLQIVSADADAEESGAISMHDFEIRRAIGVGGFSTVIEVRKKSSGKLYAMKIIKKEMIEKKDKVRQIMMERRILEKVKSPFIIDLHWAFKSADYLHMVLDFCPGGELFFHLTRFGKFSERIAQFYFCEVLLALEVLHDRGIVYRDLKPENILLDIDGHVILTDFGLSKDNFHKDSLAYSFCGSPEYMSPEMLNESGHG
jgi:serine/threonine protein kinase